MKNILLFGAGKSATVLIDYLLKNAEKENIELTVVDANINLAKSKTAGHPNARAFSFDIADSTERLALIEKSEIVISMLPPVLHLLVAKDCIVAQKSLLTASYIDADMKALQKEIEENNLLFLCEMGLDPGIDHMSAMHLFDGIKTEGGLITSFKSHCGGLIAPENDDNPWHYKISWNPRNVVAAGKQGAVFQEHGEIKELDYFEVFEDCAIVQVPETGDYAAYPNRNSLSYLPEYHLPHIETFIRTTLRHPDFCKGWYYIALAGLTDNEDETTINNYKNKTIKDWFNACLNFYTKSDNLDDFVNRYGDRDDKDLVVRLFSYLGLLSDEPIPANANTSAQILQHLLETKLVLQPNDKDMIIMLHEIEFLKNNKQHLLRSSLVVFGEDNVHTAMAKTVGLPLAIATILILKGTIQTKGLHIPTVKEIYEPVLSELALNGIRFQDTVV